jgi:hypothetical protein
MNIFPTSTSIEAPSLRTRFIIVNDRVPREGATCVTCGGKIERGYVRETRTRLFYCGSECAPELAKTAMVAKIVLGKCHEMRKL